MVETLTRQATRIAHIDAAIVTTRLPRDFRISHGTDSRHREHVLVRIVDEDGVEGFGEASPLTFFTGETASSVRTAVREYFAPLTVGTDAYQIAGLHRLWNASYPGHGSAKCALDLAIHDLLARRANRPVADLIGGALHHRIPLYKAIGFGSPEAVVAEGEELRRLGIRTFKIKVGEGVSHDVSKLAALRDRFGTEVELVLDGNGGYPPQEAVRLLRKSEPYEVAYIEQPVPAEDLEGLAFVRAHGGVPVMADESVHTLRDAHRLIAAGAVDLLGIKLIKTGGLWPARQIASLAEACGVTCVMISPFDTQLGVAAAVHLASTFPQPLAAQGLGTFLVTSGERDRQLEAHEGSVHVPSGIGFGVVPDREVFEREGGP